MCSAEIADRVHQENINAYLKLLTQCIKNKQTLTIEIADRVHQEYINKWYNYRHTAKVVITLLKITSGSNP